MNCAEHIRELLAGRPQGWQGIEPGCRIDDLRALFQLDDAWGGTGYLGEEGQDGEYVGIVLEESGNQGRLWYNEEGELLLAELIEPQEFPPVDELLKTLGPPDARLDAVVGLRRGRKNEWIYAKRGLVLYTAPGAEPTSVERAVGFAPASIDEYKRTIRLNLEQRRLPVR